MERASMTEPQAAPRAPSRWTWRLLFLFALVDGAVVFALWGAALLRAAAAPPGAGDALHLLTEALLCGSTLATVLGLCRGARFATPLAAAVLAALLYLSFADGAAPGVASGAGRDVVVLSLLGSSLLYSRLSGHGATSL